MRPARRWPAPERTHAPMPVDPPTEGPLHVLALSAVAFVFLLSFGGVL